MDSITWLAPDDAVSFQITRGSCTVAGFCITRWRDKIAAYFLAENDEPKVA
jgi:hypothetical protein